jgi:hypothetical protein
MRTTRSRAVAHPAPNAMQERRPRSTSAPPSPARPALAQDTQYHFEKLGGANTRKRVPVVLSQDGVEKFVQDAMPRASSTTISEFVSVARHRRYYLDSGLAV